MKTSKVLIALILAVVVLTAQFGTVFAAPAPNTAPLVGIVKSITLETDVNTAVTTVLVTILDQNNVSQSVRLSVDIAQELGLITTDENGMPVINANALEKTIQIDPKTVIADNGTLHPVGDALATFFSEITDYDTIMTAHADGTGFGVIAQALWLVKKLEGDSATFLAILEAKTTGDYSAFVLEDGSTPKNWGQFRKAILDGEKKGTLGVVMSSKEENKNTNPSGQGNGNNNGNKDKDKNKDNGKDNSDKDDKDKDKGNDKNK